MKIVLWQPKYTYIWSLLVCHYTLCTKNHAQHIRGTPKIYTQVLLPSLESLCSPFSLSHTWLKRPFWALVATVFTWFWKDMF